MAKRNKKYYTVRLKFGKDGPGDVNKIRIHAPDKDGNIRIGIFDGTGGSDDDLLIQAILTPRKSSELCETIHQFSKYGLVYREELQEMLDNEEPSV